MVMATKPVRLMNPVEPLGHKPTAMRTTETGEPQQLALWSGATTLIADHAQPTKATYCFDYACPVCYDSDRSREHGIGVPVARRNEPRLLGQRLFSCATHGTPFGGPCGGTRKSAPDLARYANPARSASCDWRRWRQVHNLSLGANMADIITHPRARSERVIQTRVRGRLPKSVPSLGNVRSEMRIAQYKAKQVAERIAAYNAAIETASHYIAQCRLTILDLSEQRTKGGRA